jgi:hypothetical protein
LGKGIIVVKDLRISDPTNVNTEIHNGSNPKKPTTNPRAI